MRSSFVSAAILAFVSTVSCQTPGFDVMSVPSSAIDTVAAGSAYTIKWASNATYTGTVTLSLMQGATTDTLSIGDVIAKSVTNSLDSYTWNIPQSIPSFATYGIQISWDSDPKIFQWSYSFHITGASTTSATSGSATSTSSGLSTSTKTLTLSTGTAYTATSSSTLVKTTSSALSNSTVITSTSSATAAGNGTLSTSAALTGAASKTTTSSSSTSSAAAAKSSSAAVGNLAAKGSFAVIGGVVLAFAL